MPVCKQIQNNVTFSFKIFLHQLFLLFLRIKDEIQVDETKCFLLTLKTLNSDTVNPIVGQMKVSDFGKKFPIDTMLKIIWFIQK